MQRQADTSAFQICKGNYCGRTALILIPVKGQNVNCCFAVHAHHLAQQDLGPCLDILEGYEANKYSLPFLFIFMKHLLPKGFRGLHPNCIAEASYREGAPGAQCLKHLDQEMDKLWSSSLTDVCQPVVGGSSGQPVCSCCGCPAGTGRHKDHVFCVLLQVWPPGSDLRL